MVVFVGPNNSGKTTGLSELAASVERRQMSNGFRPHVVVEACELRQATGSDLTKWLEQFTVDVPATMHAAASRTVRAGNANLLYSGSLPGIGQDGRWSAQSFTQFLVSRVSPVPLQGPAPDAYDTQSGIGSGRSTYFDSLWKDTNVEEQIADLTTRVLGTPISVSREGSQSRLHWGLLPNMPGASWSAKLAVINQVPLVSEQGAGVQQFVNLAINLVLGHEPIVIVDEPEVHLHPPQAKHAGRLLAERARRSQVFVATHSLDLLLGMLDVEVPLTIVRLDRRDGGSAARVVDADRLRKAWRDPTIRYSGLLDGLFHSGVVLCEGDSDCRYYAMALDVLPDQAAPLDLLFVHANGKAGFKKLVPILVEFGIPMAVVADFDFVREWQNTVRPLVEALSSGTSELHAMWNLMNQSLAPALEKVTVGHVRDSINTKLAELDPTDPIPTSVLKELRRAIDSGESWKPIKTQGTRALRGEALQRAKAVLDSQQTLGVHVVPFGELESFHRDVNDHGAAWLETVATSLLFHNPDSDGRAFLQQVVDGLVVLHEN
jgi:AAA domain, putative AbiEii toxin, Type IV TA system